MKTTEEKVEHIITLYNTQGKDLYYEEAVSQLQHSLQAAQFAMQKSDAQNMIIAALLHDIGHLLPDGHLDPSLGNLDHEEIGAKFLVAIGFPMQIAHLISNHVQAKRYLVATRPEYKDNLSEASKQTLILQGGPMTEEEALAYETDPAFKEIITLRLCDEQAKSEIPSIYTMDDFRGMMCSVLDSSLPKIALA